MERAVAGAAIFMSITPPVRVAIIGCGGYGAEHAKFLATYPAVKLRAVADIARERAEEFRARYGAEYATDDVASLWDDRELDAVWICTQHDTHAPLAEAACAARKPFFLEKPLAITLADCDRIVTAVERSGVMAMVGFKLRFFPAVKAAKAFLQRPLLSTAHVIDDRWPTDMWANDPVKGGGNVLSQGCHIVDTLLHLHPSAPVRVYAAGGNLHHPQNAIVDVAALSLTFADGAVASVAVGDVGVPPLMSKFAIQQSDGERSLSLHNRLNSLSTREGRQVTEHPAHPEEGAAVIDTAFVEALVNGRPSPCTVRSARRTTAVLLAAVESVKSGGVIDLNQPPYAAAMQVDV